MRTVKKKISTDNRRPTVVVVGMKAPPINGNAIICEMTSNFLTECGLNVISLNTSAKLGRFRMSYILMRAFNYFKVIVSLFIYVFRRNRSIVVNINGDLGIIFSISVVLFSRFLMYKVFMYHHSSSYTLRKTWLGSILIFFGGVRALHILCSESMANDMAILYRKARHFLVIDNSAFVKPKDNSMNYSRSSLRIGFISNLSVGKGVDISFDVLRVLRGCGDSDWSLIVAGGISDQCTETIIQSAKYEFGKALELRGAVLGERKEEFFRDIGILLFPSTYKHETQSLVIPEAQSYAIPVIAHDHAYIKTLFLRGGWDAIKPGASFVKQASDKIVRLTECSVEYDGASRIALSNFLESHNRGRKQLYALALLVSSPPLFKTTEIVFH